MFGLSASFCYLCNNRHINITLSTLEKTLELGISSSELGEINFMAKKSTINKSVIIYQAKSGAIELRGGSERETVWATQAQIVKIFSVLINRLLSRHTRNIFKDGEIEEKSNMQKMHNANSDKPVTSYSLDVILGVGYRTNSK